MIGIWIAIGLIILAVSLAFIKSNLRICSPNEILIFSGRKRRLDDGEVVGYRIIKGGRGFKIPIIESVSRMSLETIPIEIELTGALSGGVIPVNVKAGANIKIAGKEEEGLSNAVERFLNQPRTEISRIARENLEGSIRGVLSMMSPEEANSQRLRFAQQVIEESADDFRRLGLILDTFKIQNISDTENYLEAIGRKRNAEVQRDAKIAEAESEAEAREVSARAKERGSIAESESEMRVVEAQNKLRVKRANLDAESNKAEVQAQMAGDITRASEEKVLEAERIELNRNKYQAEVVIPANAEREAMKLKAEGHAARHLEDGKATAEAINLMRKEWEKGETRELFLLQQLPDLIDKITRVLSENLEIEKITVVDNGNGGGIPGLTKNLTGSVVSIMEELKNATGLDIPGILKPNNKRGKQDIGKEL
ncbi:MAG TPA: SPFH domain-containing protein [bacterium]|nr:SPFH domain-containing protein [bacterium]